MTTMLTKKRVKKVQRHLNELFGEVNSIIGNVYKTLSRTPRALRHWANGRHKIRRARRKKW